MDIPEIKTYEGELLVKVTSFGSCGSDLKSFLGKTHTSEVTKILIEM